MGILEFWKINFENGIKKKNENLGFEEKMKFYVRKLLKIKSGTLRILGILGAKILKIKSGIFRIFRNLDTRIFKI